MDPSHQHVMVQLDGSTRHLDPRVRMKWAVARSLFWLVLGITFIGVGLASQVTALTASAALITVLVVASTAGSAWLTLHVNVAGPARDPHLYDMPEPASTDYLRDLPRRSSAQRADGPDATGGAPEVRARSRARASSASERWPGWTEPGGGSTMSTPDSS